jgi:hypothetical protein
LGIQYVYGYVADILCMNSFFDRRKLSDDFEKLGIAYGVSMALSYFLLLRDVREADKILTAAQVNESFINALVISLFPLFSQHRRSVISVLITMTDSTN